MAPDNAFQIKGTVIRQEYKDKYCIFTIESHDSNFDHILYSKFTITSQNLYTFELLSILIVV